MTTFRPMRATDYDTVMSVCARIWGEHDYIRFVWDEWLADPHGQFTAVLDGEKVIGLSKFSLVTPDPRPDWWLEGLRLDPDYQGQGIGRAMHEYNLGLWKQMGGTGTLRLATSIENARVQHLCEQTGFERVGHVSVYQTNALVADGASAFKRVAPVEAASVNVSDRTCFPFEQVWRWASLSAYWLGRLAIERRLYRWRGGLGLIVTEQLPEGDSPLDDKPCLFINFASAPEDDLADLLREARTLATEARLPLVGVVAEVENPQMLAALGRAGYAAAWEKSICVYEIRQ